MYLVIFVVLCFERFACTNHQRENAFSYSNDETLKQSRQNQHGMMKGDAHRVGTTEKM